MWRDVLCKRNIYLPFTCLPCISQINHLNLFGLRIFFDKKHRFVTFNFVDNDVCNAIFDS